MPQKPQSITVLLGSPRRNGNSEMLASSFAKGASEAGYKVRAIRLCGLKIGGCIACNRCWSNGNHCFLNDDMRSVHEAIDAADVITFVSPLYFFSWTSQIKAATDRLYPYCSPNSKVDISGRRAVLLAAAGDDDESVYGGMRSSFELMCGYCRWEIAGEILALGVGAAGEIANRGDWLERALNLGRAL